MDCHEARRLLDRGVTPGSASPERATLGFHLAGCPTCRAYRTTLQERLLASLLAHEPQSDAQWARLAPSPPAGSRLGASISKALWYVALGTLATIVLGTVIVIG